jgi:hypothetical protein
MKSISLSLWGRSGTACHHHFHPRPASFAGAPNLRRSAPAQLRPWEFVAALLTIILLLSGKPCARAQAFVNLDFEAANVAGLSARDIVPISQALPGWSACAFDSLATNTATQAVYDGISGSGTFISIEDTTVGEVGPIQGKYSAWLYAEAGVYTEQLSQTGLVPAGTQSLLVEAHDESSPFVVTLGGQVVTMVPLQTFSDYILYGGDISEMAGTEATLSFTEPYATVPQPWLLELDNIQFSPSTVPEPGLLALTALGGVLFGFAHRRKTAK